MTTTYTDTFRLNKPDFRTSPWSSQLNENADRLDEILENILQAVAVETYAPATSFAAGTIVFDNVTTKLWINSVTHTTVNDTFAVERATNPTYWASLSLGVEVKGQWQNDTTYGVNDMAYDANEGLSGICNTEHTSAHTGSMRDEIDKWDILVDVQGGSGLPATDVSYDDSAQLFDAANVQEAIDETNIRIDNAASIVDTLVNDVNDINNELDTHDTAIAALQNKATTGDVRSAAIGKYIDPDALWDAAEIVDLGTVTGNVTLNFNNGLNFKMTLGGNITLKNPNNLKSGQAFGLYIIQDGTGGRTVTLESQWTPIGLIAPTIGTAVNQKNYLSGQRVDAAIIAYSGGKLST